MPNDGGHLLMEDDEKIDLIRDEPAALTYIKPFLGSDELINGLGRWCLWLQGIKPEELAKLPKVLERVNQVRQNRLKSKRPTTNELAATPTLFGEIRQPSKRFLAVPEVSSEKRTYIPLQFLESTTIASNKLYTIEGAGPYEFGIIQSLMHMAWMRVVSGRLESRYQYSGKIVYNNYPWPQPNVKQRHNVEVAAKFVLEVRRAHSSSSLAQLYEPVTMPPDLSKAHKELDRAVDRCYRRDPFPNERARVEFLFALYEQITAPFASTPPIKRSRKSRRDKA
jgi:hypothetical protein